MLCGDLGIHKEKEHSVNLQTISAFFASDDLYLIN